MWRCNPSLIFDGMWRPSRSHVMTITHCPDKAIHFRKFSKTIHENAQNSRTTPRFSFKDFACRRKPPRFGGYGVNKVARYDLQTLPFSLSFATHSPIQVIMSDQ